MRLPGQIALVCRETRDRRRNSGFMGLCMEGFRAIGIKPRAALHIYRAGAIPFVTGLDCAGIYFMCCCIFLASFNPARIVQLHMAISPDCPDANAYFYSRRRMNIESVMSDNAPDWQVVVDRSKLRFPSRCYICISNTADVVILCGHATCFACLQTGSQGLCMLCRTPVNKNTCYLLPAEIARIPAPEPEEIDITLEEILTDQYGIRLDHEVVSARLMRFLRIFLPNATNQQLLEERRKLFHNQLAPNALPHKYFGYLNISRFNPTDMTIMSPRILSSVQLRVGNILHHVLCPQVFYEIANIPYEQKSTYERFFVAITLSYRYNPASKYIFEKNVLQALGNYFLFIGPPNQHALSIASDVEDGEVEELVYEELGRLDPFFGAPAENEEGYEEEGEQPGEPQPHNPVLLLDGPQSLADTLEELLEEAEDLTVRDVIRVSPPTDPRRQQLEQQSRQVLSSADNQPAPAAEQSTSTGSSSRRELSSGEVKRKKFKRLVVISSDDEDTSNL